ncbi:hypothetical protein [Spongorhabdus nitratireducens]
MRTRKLLKNGLLSLFTLTAMSVAASPAINPLTSKVSSVVSQFNTINDHGDASGFRRGSIDPTWTKHYQGIGRSTSLPDVFYVSKSGNSSSPAAIMAVQLGAEANSRYMNHNLWQTNKSTTGGTNPGGYATTYWEDRLNDVCDHYGGLQTAGKVLAVSADNCNGGTHGQSARIYLYYTYNQYTPVRIDVSADGQFGQDSIDVGYSTAGAVGIIEDSNNLYTVMVFADGNRKVRFRQFRLEGSRMTATSSWKTWSTPTNQQNGWEAGTGAHQSINLVRQSDDQLFVVGTQKGVLENDYMFLYRVSGLGYDGSGYLTGQPGLVYQAQKRMYCGNWVSSTTRMCDFAAGAGVHVVPGEYGNSNGELTILATAHDDDRGPNSNLAPITEFRNRNVRTIDSNFGSCGNGSWATLYDDSGMDGDRNITITEYNQYREDFKYLHRSTVNFGDKASAISYCVRGGCTLTAYNDSGYKKPLFTISAGSGGDNFGWDSNLDSKSGSYYSANFSSKGDRISSIRFSCN